DFYNHLEDIKNTNIQAYELDIEINKAIETLRVIDTDYKKLSEKKEFKDVLRKFEESDTKITAAKSFFNKNNECLMNYTKKIVPKLIAKVNKIKIQPSFETVELFSEDMKVIDE
nr:LemA family protein [Bacilli bacterium]